MPRGEGEEEATRGSCGHGGRLVPVGGGAGGRMVQGGNVRRGGQGWYGMFMVI